MWRYVGKAPLPLLLKSATAASVKQVLVTPKTFPKKKHKVKAYAKSKVAIAKKKIKIKSTACTAKAFKTAWLKQKNKSQLSSDKIIKNKTELEKFAKSTKMAAVKSVNSKK